MDKLHELDTTTLLDMLSDYTVRYTRLLTDKTTGEEFLDTSETIEMLQSILDKRLKRTSRSPESAD